jgi:CheY-like chemotaxis protein
MNLLVNARDAMPKGGNLTVETKNVYLDEDFAAKHVPTQPGSYVLLSVNDTGIGMNAETQKNIFEPFYTTKKIGEGTGLGLATVYGIIKQSDGYIWADSEVDKGSTFYIYLPPANAESETKEIQEVSDESAYGAERILLVEDEEIVRNLSREMLETCGYEVIEASSGVEALEIYKQTAGKIDLLLTDVVMPQMGGRELAENLVTLQPHIKVLFTSGYTDDSIVRHGINEADINFIQKPFTFDKLTNKIRDVLDTPK